MIRLSGPKINAGSTMDAGLDLPRTVLDKRVIELLKSTFALIRHHVSNEKHVDAVKLTIGSVQVVDIGVPQGATSHGITANTDAVGRVKTSSPRREQKHQPCNRTNHVEDLKKHSLGNGKVKLANVKGSRRRSDRMRRRGRVVGRSGNRSGNLGLDHRGDLRSRRHVGFSGLWGRYCF